MARRLSSRPILCAVLDAAALGEKPAEFARGLFESGVDWIQLRDRSLEAGPLLQLARLLVDARVEVSSGLRRANVAHGSDEPEVPAQRLVIVNRRIDVARSAHANGVHLGFDALDEADARILLTRDAYIGRSFHSLQEIESHAALTLDGQRYAHLAPVWDPISKKASRPALGRELLAKACGFGLPILAQGGIEAQQAAEAIDAGAAGIAVTGTISQTRDPMQAARRLRGAIDGHSQPEG